jgi:hypothetical protein
MSIIYSLWVQGYADAPEQVKTCLDRWEKLNPSYTFELLQWSDVQSLLAPFPLKIDTMTHQTLSDIVRIALLRKTGGIWVDATVFPTKPLSQWIDETIRGTEFFSYQREASHEQPTDRPISAWFLYASEGSLLIEKLWEEILRYWSVEHHPMTDLDINKYYADPISFMGLSGETSHSPCPYHWFQHIFMYLIKKDSEFAELWHSCPRKPITVPHQIQFLAREELLHKNTVHYLTEERIKTIIENSEMQKLNWRMQFPIETMEKYSVPISIKP